MTGATIRATLCKGAYIGICAALLFACTKPNPGFDEGYASDGAATFDVVPAPGDGSPSPAADGAAAADSGAAQDSVAPVKRPRGVDVLLVVDNSSDMAKAQARLASSIKALMEPLASLPGGVRVGVVSSDMGVGPYSTQACRSKGDSGALLSKSACIPSGKPYFELPPGVATATLVNAAACLARAGTGGCGFEQPLEAMRAALSGGASAMLRPDAALVVVVLSSEDDCSAKDPGLFDFNDGSYGPYSDYRCFQQGVLCKGKKPPLARTTVAGCTPGQNTLHGVKQRYVDFARALRPDGWVQVLVIAAPVASSYGIGRRYDKYGYPYYYVQPTCSDGDVVGRPALRLDAFARGFGGAGHLAAICDLSYKPALGKVAAAVRAAFGQ